MTASEKVIQRRFEKADKDAAKAARRISLELDSLVRKLGEGVAPQTAFTKIIMEMTISDPCTVTLFERAWEDLMYWRRYREAREWRETNPNLN
jgi:hypothetical protein